jgi:hypothetical protein
MSTCHWAFQIAEDDHRSRKCDPPTVEVYAHTIVQLDAELAQTRQAATAGYHTRAIKQTDDEDNRSQTAQWSGSGPCGRRHAPQAQGRTPPECDPLPADAYAWTIARGDNNNNQPCQTARWSGSSPSRRCRFAPRTDTTGRTQPCKMARQGGGKVQEVRPPVSISGQDTLERGVMSGELPLTYLPLYSLLYFYSLFSYF